MPFSHFDDSLAGGGELLEPLEPPGEEAGLFMALEGGEGEGEAGLEAGAGPHSGSSKDWEGPSQLWGLSGPSSQASEHRLSQGGGWAGGTSGAGGPSAGEQLAAALQGCAAACGGLAAIDSLQYLTG